MHFFDRQTDAAINQDGTSRHVVAGGIAHEDNAARNLFRFAESSLRKSLAHRLQLFLAEELSLSRSINPSGVHNVDTNTFVRQFRCCCASHLVNRGLGHVVRHRAGHWHPTVRRANDDDRAFCFATDHVASGSAEQ